MATKKKKQKTCKKKIARGCGKVMAKITELVPGSSTPATTVKHDDAWNRLLRSLLCFREVDFKLSGNSIRFLVDISLTFGSRYSSCIGRREGHCCPNDEYEVLHDRIVSKDKVEAAGIHRSHSTVVKVSPGKPSLLKKFA